VLERAEVRLNGDGPDAARAGVCLAARGVLGDPWFAHTNLIDTTATGRHKGRASSRGSPGSRGGSWEDVRGKELLTKERGDRSVAESEDTRYHLGGAKVAPDSKRGKARDLAESRGRKRNYHWRPAYYWKKVEGPELSIKRSRQRIHSPYRPVINKEEDRGILQGPQSQPLFRVRDTRCWG